MNRSKKLITFLIVLTLCFIWGHSMASYSASAQESGMVTELVSPFLELFLGKGNVTDHLVRKLAHVAEYCILGIEFTLLFPDHAHRIRTVMGHCFLTAFLDETIQIFSGRGPFISDVWIDLAGSALGMAVAIAIVSLILRRRKEKNGHEQREG